MLVLTVYMWARCRAVWLHVSVLLETRGRGKPCMTREKEKDAVGSMHIGLVQLAKKTSPCQEPLPSAQKKKRLGLDLA